MALSQPLCLRDDFIKFALIIPLGGSLLAETRAGAVAWERRIVPFIAWTHGNDIGSSACIRALSRIELIVYKPRQKEKRRYNYLFASRAIRDEAISGRILNGLCNLAHLRNITRI